MTSDLVTSSTNIQQQSQIKILHYDALQPIPSLLYTTSCYDTPPFIIGNPVHTISFNHLSHLQDPDSSQHRYSKDARKTSGTALEDTAVQTRTTSTRHNQNMPSAVTKNSAVHVSCLLWGLRARGEASVPKRQHQPFSPDRPFAEKKPHSHMSEPEAPPRRHLRDYCPLQCPLQKGISCWRLSESES